MPKAETGHHPAREQGRRPGLRSDMQPAPRSDYGGSGKLAGTTALITGGDSGFGRPLEPVAVAPSHILLASNDAIWMTGQVLHPNGGEIIGG